MEFRIATPSSRGCIGQPGVIVPSEQNRIVVPQEMSLVAFKTDMQYSFLFSNFVWSTYGRPWLQLSAKGKLGVLPQQACSAFSQVTFGRHHARQDLQIDGAERYGQAVSKVRAGLSNPSDPAFSELLVPVLIFLLYSSSDASRGESQSHVMGLFTLLQIAGPKSFQGPLLRAAFSSCRATLVTVGLLKKMRLFLEREDWKNDPWASSPTSKSSQDRLIDILVAVPGFLQDQQELRTEYQPGLQQTLTRKVLHQLEILFRWRWQWEVEHPSAAKELIRVGEGPKRLYIPPEAGNTLQYSAFSEAVEISLYNAVLLCLLGLLYSELTIEEARIKINKIAVDGWAAPNSISATVLRLPFPAIISMRAAAVEIVRSFEYQLAHISQSEDTPALFWLFPLGLASKVLRRDSAMTHWIQQMLDTSEVTSGYGRGDNAFGFGFYELPDVTEGG